MYFEFSVLVSIFIIAFLSLPSFRRQLRCCHVNRLEGSRRLQAWRRKACCCCFPGLRSKLHVRLDWRITSMIFFLAKFPSFFRTKFLSDDWMQQRGFITPIHTKDEKKPWLATLPFSEIIFCTVISEIRFKSASVKNCCCERYSCFSHSKVNMCYQLISTGRAS